MTDHEQSNLKFLQSLLEKSLRMLRLNKSSLPDKKTKTPKPLQYTQDVKKHATPGQQVTHHNSEKKNRNITEITRRLVHANSRPTC